MGEDTRWNYTRFLNAVHKKINVNTGEKSNIECPVSTCKEMVYYQHLCVGCRKPSGSSRSKKYRRR